MYIRKILVAVDGSEPSFCASTYAIDWAKRNDAELIAIHVIYPTYSPFQTALSPRPERIQEITKKEKEEGQRYVDKVEQQSTENKVSVNTDVIVGDYIGRKRDCRVCREQQSRYHHYWKQRYDWTLKNVAR